MERYTIYCTEEQTKMAFDLGAPIFVSNESWLFGQQYIKELNKFVLIPTAEQMIGWLEEQNLQVTLHVNCFDKWCSHIYTSDVKLAITTNWLDTRKEATLAAISSALEYLTNNKK